MDTPASTPAASSHAPTPISTTFKDSKDGTSGAPTPTSATAGKASSSKKKKTAASSSSAAVAAAANGGGVDESETDSREPKKVRTNFGAARK